MKTIIFGLAVTLLFWGGIVYYNRDCLFGIGICHDVKWNAERDMWILKEFSCRKDLNGQSINDPQYKKDWLENSAKYEFTVQDVKNTIPECRNGTQGEGDEDFLLNNGIAKVQYLKNLQEYENSLPAPYQQ
jgi:hypothetical protein